MTDTSLVKPWVYLTSQTLLDRVRGCLTTSGPDWPDYFELSELLLTLSEETQPK
jgi:hypothetical protein